MTSPARRIIVFGSDQEKILERVKSMAPRLGIYGIVHDPGQATFLIGGCGPEGPFGRLELRGMKAQALLVSHDPSRGETWVFCPTDQDAEESIRLAAEEASAKRGVAFCHWEDPIWPGLGERGEVDVSGPEVCEILRPSDLSDSAMSPLSPAQLMALAWSEAKSSQASSAQQLAMFLHDLAKPLTTLGNAFYFLSKDPHELSPEERVGASGWATRSLGYVETLVEAFRQEKSPEAEVPFCLSTLTAEIWQELGGRDHLRLDCGELPEIVGRQGVWRRILSNLLHNAIHYSDQAKDDCWIRVEGHERSRATFLRLHDNGMGISKEDAKKVFQAGVRGSSEKGNGSGLGLTIVREQLRGQGGAIRCLSGDGQGTTFIIRIPKRKCSQDVRLDPAVV